MTLEWKGEKRPSFLILKRISISISENVQIEKLPIWSRGRRPTCLEWRQKYSYMEILWSIHFTCSNSEGRQNYFAFQLQSNHLVNACAMTEKWCLWIKLPSNSLPLTSQEALFDQIRLQAVRTESPWFKQHNQCYLGRRCRKQTEKASRRSNYILARDEAFASS